MSQWTIGRRLTAGFAAVLVTAFALGAFAYGKFGEVREGARLITQGAQEHEIASLRTMFATFENGQLHARLDEYAEVNIEFHQAIIRMSRNSVLIALAENLFAHMRMIRRRTIGEPIAQKFWHVAACRYSIECAIY